MTLDFAAAIAHDSETFAATLDAGVLDRRVPSCPEWALRDLAWHLGRVQRFWTRVVRAGADVDPAFPAGDEAYPDGADLAPWMRESTADLLDALRTVAPDTPAWVWWRDDRTVGAIARHQVQETAVHRWDAESAVGVPAPLDPAVAADGIDEFVWISRQLREPAPITFVATDSGRSFPVSDAEPTVTVSGPASDLVLCCYRRFPPDAVAVAGDPRVLEAFLQAIA